MSPHYALRTIPLLQADTQCPPGYRAYLVQASREYFGGSSRTPEVMSIKQLSTCPSVAGKVGSEPPRKFSFALLPGP